jgi:signal transduction histidine kinase
LAPVAADRDETLARWKVHPLALAAPLIRARLETIAAESEHLIVVSDAQGVLLELEGNARVRSRAADSMNFTEGALWSEGGAGTNAVGTALAADHAVQIFASEHFVEVVQAWTCSAAPVHDPDTGELLGVIDLTGLKKRVHPDSLAVAVAAAFAIETDLRYRMQERDARLRTRYEGRLVGRADRRALVAPTGRLVADDFRGWLQGTRLELPPGGGELILPSGARAFAEPVGHEEAFIVRELAGQGARGRRRPDELRVLAGEQAALRRLATAVASGVPPPEVFAAVAREVGQVLGVDATHMARYEPDGTAIDVGSWSRGGDHHLSVGTPVPLDGSSVCESVWHTGRPARKDNYNDASGEIAALLEQLGIRSSVGAPIVVDGDLWGVMIASSKTDAPLPPDTESRIAAFTELVATAISTTEARAEVGRLAEEQAALLRVATLVAQGVPPSELFGAVAEEVGRLLGADLAGMIRYEPDHTVIAVATWAAVGEHAGVGGRWPLDGGDLAVRISRTGRAARMDDYEGVAGRMAAFLREQLGIGSSVGSPIVVEGRLWGALFVHATRTEPLPADTESRLVNFTKLVATAMSNAQARDEVHRLADEQAALRRVATLVAHESSPGEVFEAVAEEVGRLLRVNHTRLFRYEADCTATVVAAWGDRDLAASVGTRWAIEGENVTGLVFRTERPARIDDYTKATGPLAAEPRKMGMRCLVGAPIIVKGRPWGVMIAGWREAEPLPPETESRMGQFTDLVATAISNIQVRSELAASRARIVAATDEERRRVVRDLHDGAQQRLVHTVVTLKLAREALHDEEAAGAALVAEALDHTEQAIAELRELAHGILPGVLAHGGLRAGVQALASRTPVPVQNRVSVRRLPAAVEATAYFVVAEALTNVAKHSGAKHAVVIARIADDTLRVEVRDDGVGGARPDGSGLLGLADRLAVLDGRLRVESPADGGTLVTAAIPLPG